MHPYQQWDALCSELGYTPGLKTAGLELLQRLQSSQDKLGSTGDAQTVQGQLAAAAYLASSKGKMVPGMSVTALCSHLSMHMKDFFNHVLENHARLYPGTELKEIVPVKRAFLVSTVVHAKWKEFSRQLFPTGFAGATATDTEATVQLSFELGWLLFAHGKCRMAAGATDPLSAYHLLANLIHLLLALIPEEAQTSGVFWPKLDGPVSIASPTYPLPPSAQEHLWGLLKAVPAELSKQQPTVGVLLTDLANVFGIANMHRDGVLTPAGGTRLRELLTPANLPRTVESIRATYAGAWSASSQLDDTYFLQPQAHAPVRAAHASPAASPCRPSAYASMASPAARRRTGDNDSRLASPGAPARAPLLTPLRGSNPMGRAHTVPQTPMSSQLESVGWLRDAVKREPDASSLSRYFDACATSPRAAIEARVAQLFDKVGASLAAVEMGGDVEEQLVHGKRLYYKMLLSFLEAEERRLGQTNFSALLSNETFHTSLLACCLESVYASYSTPSMQFPAVLDQLELQPFDFGKVIESFIKHEPHLPAHLKTHFAEIESCIVECLAWQESSPLHVLMSEYDAALSSAESNGDDAAPPASPAKATSTRANAALEQFVKKCLYLGAKRIQDMCLRLLLPSALVQQVWAAVKLVLDKARFLLVGRHLDQLLMCCVYGVCKVNQRPVTFRHIIEQYRRQQGASPRTFREVRMQSADDPPQDIIQFYNLIFIPAMKDHLLYVCGSAKGTTADGSGVTAAGGAHANAPIGSAPSPDISQARGTSSPRHVSAAGARDVFVSQCSPHPHLTPRTRTLYAFSDTPATSTSERLRDINSNINATASPASAASALDALAGLANGAANGHVAHHGDDVVEPRRAAQSLDLGGSGGVMASGQKRARAIMEPQRSGSSAGNSSFDDSEDQR